MFTTNKLLSEIIIWTWSYVCSSAITDIFDDTFFRKLYRNKYLPWKFRELAKYLCHSISPQKQPQTTINSPNLPEINFRLPFQLLFLCSLSVVEHLQMEKNITLRLKPPPTKALRNEATFMFSNSIQSPCHCLHKRLCCKTFQRTQSLEIWWLSISFPLSLNI